MAFHDLGWYLQREIARLGVAELELPERIAQHGSTGVSLDPYAKEGDATTVAGH